MALNHQIKFVTRFLSHPNVVGAIAPSSRALAEALCEPYRRHTGPATVLEVGAGTGAVTKQIGNLLGDEDQFDVCEIDDAFADILENHVLRCTRFAAAVAAGRVRLFRSPVQDLNHEARYDFVISGLPLTVFDLRDVHEIFKVIQRCLKPGGVFSYFEYVGLRRASRALSVGRKRDRIRFVSAYLNRRIRRHQFDRRTVLWNFLPAHARYLSFDDLQMRSA